MPAEFRSLFRRIGRALGRKGPSGGGASSTDWTLILSGTSYVDSYTYQSDPAPGGLRRFSFSDGQNADGPPWLDPGNATNTYTFVTSGVTMIVGPATTRALVEEITISGIVGPAEGTAPLFDPTGYSALESFSQYCTLRGAWPADWSKWPATLQYFSIATGGGVDTYFLTGSIPALVGAPFAETMTSWNSCGHATQTGPLPACPYAATADAAYVFGNETLDSGFALGVPDNLSHVTGTGNLQYDASGTHRNGVVSITGGATCASVSYTLIDNVTTGWSGARPAKLLKLIVKRNLWNAAGVNACLAAFVATPYTGSGTEADVIIDLSGVGMAAPTGQGITDVATLQGRGNTITTN